MLATVLLIIGIATGFLGILDLLLSDLHKTKIELWTLRVWSWLDHAKTKALMAWLNRPNYRIWLVTAGCIIAFICANLYLLGNQWSQLGDEVYLAAVVVGSYILGNIIGRLIVGHVLASGSSLMTYVRVLVYTVFVMVALATSLLYAAYEITMMRIDVHLSNEAPDYISLYSSVLLTLTIMITAIFVMTAVTPLLGISVAQLSLLISEFFVRKIAESSKGVVLAASTLITGIGAALKAFM